MVNPFWIVVLTKNKSYLDTMLNRFHSTWFENFNRVENSFFRNPFWWNERSNRAKCRGIKVIFLPCSIDSIQRDSKISIVLKVHFFGTHFDELAGLDRKMNSIQPRRVAMWIVTNASLQLKITMTSSAKMSSSAAFRKLKYNRNNWDGSQIEDQQIIITIRVKRLLLASNG